MSNLEIQKATNAARDGPSTLPSAEAWWRDHCVWLKDQGYTLRDRYQPDWVPSWKKDQKLLWLDCEDGLMAISPMALDAIRQDGKLVALKRICPSDDPHELGFGRLFSSDSLAQDPNNYCVPLLDVLQVPDDDDMIIVVMPLLYYYDAAPFQTIGEGVEFLRQLLEGLHFMHQRNIAHRDVTCLNVMADVISLFDAPPHPRKASERCDFKGPVRQRYSRTEKPVKHYFIDFGLSREYKTEDAPHLEPAGWGGDRSVPEFQKRDGRLCDPFAVDVYCMGNFIRVQFTEGDDIFKRKPGFEFLNDLVRDMVLDDPTKRPSMKEVVLRFNDIVERLSNWKLRSRVGMAKESRSRRVFREIGHWMKQAMYMVKRVPAIPRA